MIDRNGSRRPQKGAQTSRELLSLPPCRHLVSHRAITGASHPGNSELLSNEWGWASLRRDEVRVMLAGPNRQENDVAPGFTGSLYFRTDDADALWQLLKDNTRVCYAIQDFDYGMREFAIYDNNGYVLQFGQPIRTRP
jgi:uncharacterized glyoxalase superfamily protein PhnB